MQAYRWVALGGATGVFLRGIISELYPLANDFHIVWINIIGSFLIALLFTMFPAGLYDRLRWTLGSGMLGGFTTMSTFSLDLLKLLETKQWLLAVQYLTLSIIGGLLAAWLGYALGNRLKSKGDSA